MNDEIYANCLDDAEEVIERWEKEEAEFLRDGYRNTLLRLIADKIYEIKNK